MEQKYGEDYYNTWHSYQERDPEPMPNVKGLEDCVYIVLERQKNDLRSVIRCGNYAQVKNYAKHPTKTEVIGGEK